MMGKFLSVSVFEIWCAKGNNFCFSCYNGINVRGIISFDDFFSHEIVDGHIASLVELTCRAVAQHIPFEGVENFRPPVPEQLQLRIAFWSFPETEEDIRYELEIY